MPNPPPYVRTSTRQFGRRAETLACLYLKKKGFVILRRNYRYRNGEIDIVAKNKELILFVEVKSKTGTDFGSPKEAVTTGKQETIRRTAMHYLVCNRDITTEDYRFDVISIQMKSSPRIEHIVNCF